jgi:hypothetical protein
VNPWSGAEPGSEAAERALFARRARAEQALGPAVVPSLASVLEAARTSDDGRETRAQRGAQSRAFVAMALAAACMAAAVTKLPTATTRGSIAADFDAGAPSATNGARGAGRAIEPAMATCELDDEVLMSEERACFAPTALFTVAPPPTTAALSSAPPPIACTASESCPMSTAP